jgi:exodeoxyribonuclease VII large subunit
MQFDRIVKTGVLRKPTDYIIAKRAILTDQLSDRVKNSIQKSILVKEKAFSTAVSKIDALSPIKTMLRGYAAVLKNNQSVNSVRILEKDDNIHLRFSDGIAECMVDKVVLNNGKE